MSSAGVNGGKEKPPFCLEGCEIMVLKMLVKFQFQYGRRGGQAVQSPLSRSPILEPLLPLRMVPLSLPPTDIREGLLICWRGVIEYPFSGKSGCCPIRKRSFAASGSKTKSRYIGQMEHKKYLVCYPSKVIRKKRKWGFVCKSKPQKFPGRCERFGRA